ncbi:MAG: precorrin-4 C(11)-methyltransferase [Nitrospirota bacterium]|nr:precorrin-4 C(11)-methyltransferase [Nitrospirota bacterium]
MGLPTSPAGSAWDRVYVVGAGPGAPDLITLRGQRLLAEADRVVYAGSLVNPAVLAHARPDAETVDSAELALPEIVGQMVSGFRAGLRVVRLHSGDPSIYGALTEQLRELERENVPWEVVPGVPSAMAAAAALGVEYTLPEVAQSVIFTRMEGRTPVPEREKLAALAAHGTTLVLFLSVQMIHKVVPELLREYPPETPVAVVYKASWPEQKIVRGTLEDIVPRVREAGIRATALIVVGRVLDGGALPDAEFHASRLYDPTFSHGFRRALGSRSEGTAP